MGGLGVGAVKPFDVNTLIYAHRVDTPQHVSVRDWFESEVNGMAAFGMAELVLSGFVRVVTSPNIFANPTPLDLALTERERSCQRWNFVPVRPRHGHFDIFIHLCREGNVRGKLAADGCLAALVIEHGRQWSSLDRRTGHLSQGRYKSFPVEDLGVHRRRRRRMVPVLLEKSWVSQATEFHATGTCPCRYAISTASSYILTPANRQNISSSRRRFP